MPRFSPQKSFDFFRKAGGNTEVPLAPRSVVWVKPGKPNAEGAAARHGFEGGFEPQPMGISVDLAIQNGDGPDLFSAKPAASQLIYNFLKLWIYAATNS